jgi:diguanylate cyclase (GGDEF)-like protein/PAS domain S-box-containing protein
LKPAVLILDDEPSVLDVLGPHLTKKGYTCSCTTSPTRALALLKGKRHLVLVTDLRMPEMDGMEVVAQARRMDPDLAVVVVTAMADISNAIRAIRLGADDYLLKPFDLAEFEQAVARATQKREHLLENRQYQDGLETRVRVATEDLDAVTRELRETKEYLESLLHSTVDAIITSDQSNRIEFVNAGAEQMVGVSKGELEGTPLAALYAGGEEEVAQLRRRLTEDGPIRNCETEMRRADGGCVPVNVSLSVAYTPEGEAKSVLAVCKDITEQKRLQQELREMSIKDSLTGLYNQRHFYDRLEAEIERGRRQNHSLSLLLFDIDDFKGYNDNHGHLEGDRVLRAVGSVVMECTRDHVDIGFRYGGDEFTVILPEADESVALRIAERIRLSFEARHFDSLTLSIGLMAYSQDRSIRSFIQSVDTMMYEAKRSGGNRVCTGKPDDAPSEDT